MTTFDAICDSLAGTVSVWCGRPGTSPVYTRLADTPHYPASTMKIGVMVAAYRLADSGELDLDAEIAVHEEFTSAVGGRFTMDKDYDSDPEVWARLGQTMPLRQLIRRMIIRSSNLATNLVLEATGYATVQRVWRLAGAGRSLTRRGIEDYAAAEAGVDNEVTAADLGALMSALQLGALASEASTREMIDVLCDQEFQVDLARGLPEGTPVALKNGWVDGVRLSAAIVFPGDAKPYVLTACVSSPEATSETGDDPACEVLARLSAAMWDIRHEMT